VDGGDMGAFTKTDMCGQRESGRKKVGGYLILS
jgi:hypothetical protein